MCISAHLFFYILIIEFNFPVIPLIFLNIQLTKMLQKIA